jgi:serine protease Do
MTSRLRSAHGAPAARSDLGPAAVRSPVGATWTIAVFAVVAMLWATAAQAETVPESFADLADRLLPAVVNVSTTQIVRERQLIPEIPEFPPGSPFEEFFRDFFERQLRPNVPRRATSLGSGFIIDAEGYIVTNNHVIAEADEIKIILQDDTELEAEIIGRDAKTDLALLKVEPEKPLPYLSFGDSDATRVGDWIMVIGNPFGLGGTVTAGIVSAHHRFINVGPYDDFIQTDASINRGNSGGPMFDMDGKVIGIATAIFSPSGGSVGLGFAMPSNLAQPVIAQLREFGRTRRGWLGVRIQTVTDEIAESLGLERARGALVAKVNEGQPAAVSGIEAGDVILEFAGKPVDDSRALQRIVAETPVGKTVKIKIWREEREITLEVVTGELEKFEEIVTAENEKKPPAERSEMLGLTLSTVTPELREQYSLDENITGVVITDVAAASDAAEKGLRPGDVIVEISQEEVATPADVEKRIAGARDAGRKSVLLLVERQGNLQFVPLRVAES